MSRQLYGNLNKTDVLCEIKLSRILQRSFLPRNNFKPNFVASFVLLGTAFSLKLLISSSVTLTKRLAAILKKTLIGDYRVIITELYYITTGGPGSICPRPPVPSL